MKNLVLTFHNVQDATWFENTISTIGKFYTFGTLDQLYARLKGIEDTQPRMCFITFDDGERSVYEIVFPVISRLHIPIAMFVSPSNITQGGRAFWFQRVRALGLNSMETSLKQFPLHTILQKIDEDFDGKYTANLHTNINRDMFQKLLESGLVTFGAHTLNHPILANETEAVAKEEIVQSIEQLSQLQKSPVRYFAYPNGRDSDFSEREVRTLKDQDITMAFTTIQGFAAKRDMFRIHRVGLTKGNKWHVVCKILFPRMFATIKRMFA